MSREGVRVRGGRLRVDAARAVAKLRDYQLPDPIAWAHEVVRAAVLLGARELFVEADADDVWLGWSGPRLPEDDLVRLFDDLVTGGRERRAQRLLATGVNTALALRPRFVDVWSLGERPARVRYAPHLLQLSEEGHAEGLRGLTIEHAPRPEGLAAIAEGGLVHMRRPIDGGVVLRFLTARTPPELEALVAACRDLRVPLHARPRPLPGPPPLLRVEAPAGAGLRGHAELVRPEHTEGPGLLVWCELGVALAAEPLALPKNEGARLPLRVTLDHDRLPANAARSAVRDEPLVEEGRRLATELVEALVRALPDALAQAEADPGRHFALRAAALALLVGGGAEPSAVALDGLPSWVRPLADAPLLRDALGRHRTLRALAAGGMTRVHRGLTPVRDTLAPWIGDVPWIPVGDPAYRLFGDAPPEDAAALVASAEERMRARTKFLERPELDPHFVSDEHDLVIARFERSREAPEGSWCEGAALDVPGLEGQLALRPLDRVGPDGLAHAEITLLVLRRPIQELRVRSELPLRAIVTAGTLVATPGYDGVVAGDAVDAVVRAVMTAAVRAGEALASALAGGAGRSEGGGVSAALGPRAATEERAMVETLVRATMRLALRMGHERGGSTEVLRSLTVRPSPLLDAPAFRSFGGEALTLAALKELAPSARVFGVVAPDAAFPDVAQPPVLSRPILRLSEPDAEALPLLVGSRSEGPARRRGGVPLRLDTPVHVVRYEGSVDPATRRGLLRAALSGCGTELAFAEPGLLALLGARRERNRGAELVLHHAGRSLGPPIPWPSAPAGLVLAVDDDALVPRAGGTGLADPARLEARAYDADTWRARLAAALAAHLCGEATPGFSTSEEPAACLLWLAELGAPDDAAARLAERPLVPDLGGRLRPFAYFRLAGAGTAGFVAGLPSREGLRTEGIELPVMALEEADARRLGQLFGSPVVDRAADAEAAIEAARQERSWQAILARPVQPERAPAEGSVRLRGPGLVGWARPAQRGAQSLVVLAAGRRLEVRTGDEAPRGLDVWVDVGRELVDAERGTLGETGTSRVQGALREGRRQLLLERLAAPRAIEEDGPFVEVALGFLSELSGGRSKPVRRSKPVEQVLDALLDAPVFPRLGPAPARTSIRYALDGEEVRLTQGIAEWIAPRGKPHALDRRAVLAFPEPLEADRAPWVELARRLAGHLGTPRDVTKEARRLFEARRVQADGRGKAVLPPWVDRRFAVSLELLAQRSAQGTLLGEVLPIGEAALVPEGPSRLVLVGREARTLPFPLVPFVMVVARSPYEDELEAPETMKRLEGGMRVVLAETLRWTADDVPEAHWPPAVRSGVRKAALLGGRAHLDAIAAVPLFLTTAGTYVSYDRLREETNRFGALWVVADERNRRQPLDPARSALVLPDDERARLHAILPTAEAERELELDEALRRNLERPEVRSIAPGARERGWSLAAAERPVPGGTAWVLPLHPEAEHERGLHTFLGRRPLGPAPDGCRWPTWASVSSDALTPDRVHGAPKHDEALRALQAELAAHAEALLLPTLGGDGLLFAVTIDADRSRDALGDRGIEVRGRLGWSGVGGPGEVQITDAQRGTARALEAVPPGELVPRAVPLTGSLLVARTEGASPLRDTEREAIGRKAYLAVLEEAAKATDEGGERAELAWAALVQGVVLGHARPLLPAKKKTRGPAWASTPLDFLAGAHRDLRALAAALKARTPVVVLRPEEQAQAETLGPGPIVLVRSESLAARVAFALLGERAVTLREHLGVDAAAPAPAPAVPSTGATEPPPRAGENKKARPKASAPLRDKERTPAQLLARHIGSLVRRVAPEHPRLLVDARAAEPLVAPSPEATRLAGASDAMRLALAHPARFAETAPLLAIEVLEANDEAALVRFLDTLGT